MDEHESTSSERLNRGCFCITLDRDQLRVALETEARDLDFWTQFIEPRAHLFSDVPVFLSAAELSGMEDVVRAEAVAATDAYKAAALSSAPEVARTDHGPAGALMGTISMLAPRDRA